MCCGPDTRALNLIMSHYLSISQEVIVFNFQLPLIFCNKVTRECTKEYKTFGIIRLVWTLIDKRSQYSIREKLGEFDLAFRFDKGHKGPSDKTKRF